MSAKQRDRPGCDDLQNREGTTGEMCQKVPPNQVSNDKLMRGFVG